jgi:hypothetical protein
MLMIAIPSSKDFSTCVTHLAYHMRVRVCVRVRVSVHVRVCACVCTGQPHCARLTIFFPSAGNGNHPMLGKHFTTE